MQRPAALRKTSISLVEQKSSEQEWKVQLTGICFTAKENKNKRAGIHTIPTGRESERRNRTKIERSENCTKWLEKRKRVKAKEKEIKKILNVYATEEQR